MTNNKIKVLIVDDNSDDVYLIKELLKDITATRFELLHEESLNSALELIEKDKDKFDCILLDLNLPDSLGTDTLKNVLNKFPGLSIVVLTVLDDEDVALKSLQYGAQDYLVKGKINGEIVSRSIRYAIERKKAENGLRESEKKYKNIADTILEGLWMIDEKGNTTYVNQQLAEILDYKPEEIINHPFFNFVDKSVIQEAKEHFKKRKQGIKERYEFLFNKKDGSPIWVTVCASPLFDKNQKFIGAMGLITDITERKKFTDKLKKAATEWYSTFNAIRDSVCILDTEGIILRCNNVTSEILEKPCEDIIGKTCWKLIHKVSYPTEECPAIRARKTLHRETSIIKIDNKWFHISVDPIMDDNLIGYVHIMSDISKYIDTRDRLKESEQLYRTIVDYSNDMIWTLDIEGNLLFSNRCFGKISGYKLEYWKGKCFYSLIIEKDLPRVTDIFHSTLIAGQLPYQPNQYEMTIKSKYDKNIILSVNTAPIYSKGRIIGTVSCGRDITENKKTEEKIKKAAENLAKSNKELEQFAYIASHDLQEPLRSISGFVELLARRYKDKLDPDANEFIEYISSGTKRMRDMIDDLLILSRVGTRGKEFKPTNISDILKIALENLHALIEKNQAIITNDDMPTIMVDDTQLIELFQNLIDNAIKFRRKETPHIHISATLSTKQEGEEWIFSVQDNGIGIDSKDFDKLFVAFHRLHGREKYPGTGIGLAICKKIVERHKGKIWIESKLGEGSTFYFTIPK